MTAMSILVEAGVSLNDGYKYYTELPLNFAKHAFGAWVVSHLISLGARETDEEAQAVQDYETSAREIRISERIWEWVSKY